jgi:hypothetical protein
LLYYYGTLSNEKSVTACNKLLKRGIYVIKESQLKDSTLDDSAEIYQPREQLTEKQKLSEMTFSEKVTYFNNYYRFKTLVGIAILGLIIYAAYSILTPKPATVLYAAVLNYALDDETAATLQTDLGEYLNINPAKQEVKVDTSFYLGTDDDASEYTMSMQQKLVTYLYASEIDIIIAPESVFASYAHNGYMSKLSDELPTDLFSALSDSFYYSGTEDDATESAYGIHLDDAIIYDKSGAAIDNPVIGIVVNSKYKQNGTELIRYLFDLN